VNPLDQIRSYAEAMLRQGYTKAQVRDSLLRVGWQPAMVWQVLPNIAEPKPQPNFFSLKRLAFVMAAATVIAGGGLSYVIATQQKADRQTPAPAQTATAKTADEQPKDITTTIDPEKFQQFTAFKDVSFWVSKQWSGDEPASGTILAHVSLFNYQPETIEAELTTDGRLPENASFYHDIPQRQLTSYPYSLDKMYEIQITLTEGLTDGPLSEKSVLQNRQDKVKDLRFYKVNGTQVADFILKGDSDLVDQRTIFIRDSTGKRQVRITINPNASRKAITKGNFDGLMELVGSIRFSEHQI
jgi:hypothetical protein